jgi:hypothetical protein
MKGIEVIFSQCCFWSLNASGPYIAGQSEYYISLLLLHR